MDMQFVIQHEINQPGVTPWHPTIEDMFATDYVPAYFNSKDTTKPIGQVPVKLIEQPIKTSPTDCWPFLIASLIINIALVILAIQ